MLNTARSRERQRETDSRFQGREGPGFLYTHKVVVRIFILCIDLTSFNKHSLIIRVWAAVAVALPYRPYFRETGSTGVRYSYRKLRLLTRTYLGTTLFLLNNNLRFSGFRSRRGFRSRASFR